MQKTNPTSKITASTQQHLDIEDIAENLIILKNNQVAMVLITTSVNFDILSEAEQDATIYAYAAFLNSLSFTLEVVIRSKRADITTYYQHLVQSMEGQPNPDLRRQIQKYMEFIQTTVQQKTILDKHFYLIIRFSTLELGLKMLKKQPTQYKNRAELIKNAKIQLFPKRDHIIKQAARLGLSARQLNTKEIIELFYDIYNPAPLGTSSINIDSAAYTQPLVRPAIETPNPSPDSYGQQADNTAGTQPQLRSGETDPNTDGQGFMAPTIIPTGTQPASHQEALQNLQGATSDAKKFVNQQKEFYNQSQEALRQAGTLNNPPGFKRSIKGQFGVLKKQ